MYIRLKQRIISYMIIFLMAVMFGKLIFLKNNCKDFSTNGTPVTQHHHTVDLFNLNEHHIEFEMVKAINKMKRSYRVQPIDVPAVDKIGTEVPQPTIPPTSANAKFGSHVLGVLVPYRERFEELKVFVPYIHKYLQAKNINFKVFVINQVDSHRFNRASLINIGVLFAKNESCDYIVMHDVDLLPLNKDLNYGYPERGPFHVAAPHLHPKYHYDTFVGGILILSVKQFEELNGLSNIFWGWGREDDEFNMRITDSGMTVYRHGDEITTGLNTFKHIHGRSRKRDYKILGGQKKAMFSRDRSTGLNNLAYELVARQELRVDGYACTVLDVKLSCDFKVSPWCALPHR